MNKVTVLIEGYAKINKDGTWEATSTTTLIEHGNIKIIMDPGCDRKLLNENLASNNLGLEDIVWVFLSHRHLDNTVLIGIFPNAKVIDDELFQDGPHGELHKTFIPGTDIEIVKTPGHSPRHGSLLVNTSDGVVAVAGDVFWFKDGEEQTQDINKPGDFADGNFEDLKKSRQLLLDKADWIIPGHGKMFKKTFKS